MFFSFLLELSIFLLGHCNGLLDEQHIDSHAAHQATPPKSDDLLKEERARANIHKHVVEAGGNGKILVRREKASALETDVVTAQESVSDLMRAKQTKKRTNTTRAREVAGDGSGSGSGSGAGKKGCENIKKISWMKWQAGAKCTDGQENTLKGHFDTPWNEESPMLLAEYKGTCKSDSLDTTNYCVGQGGNSGPGMFVPNDKVENIPKCDGTDTSIIKLQDATKRTITFAEPIVGLILLFISLNGNGWDFDFEFDIIMSGDGGAANGFYGAGTSKKTTEGGKFKLEGTGEPHGMLEFRLAIKELTWTSQRNENWNGFTFGIRDSLNGFTCDNGEYDVENVIMPGNKKEASGFTFEASARIIARVSTASLVALAVNLLL